MGVGISKQIGWSQEANLLYEILRELDYLNLVTADVTGNCVCPTTTTTTLPSVTIGTQTWTLRNLDVTTYANGDVIPEVTDENEWVNLTTGAWCYPNNDPALGAIYGKLYNWYAVNDPRGLAPLGYHVPTQTEFQTLSDYLGGDAVSGGPLKEIGLDYWQTPNTGATNSSGFTALGAGDRSSSGLFSNLNVTGNFWSSTETIPNILSNFLSIYFNNVIIVTNDQAVIQTGLSVRLIKD
jgi:uncharacterized protein (TIGR02145 family)